jgi:hypothetical protein
MIYNSKGTGHMTYNNSKGTGTREEILEVDVSTILKYVSRRELERYENAEFQAEADAEAAVQRFEAEELAKRWLEKNNRTNTNRMRSGLGMDPDTTVRTRGTRGRDRGRPRGRARGRGAWTGRKALLREDEALQLSIAESNVVDWDEDEEDNVQIRSPDLTRSSFVANSALPASPDLTRSSFVANSALPASPLVPKLPPQMPRYEESEELDKDEDMEDVVDQGRNEDQHRSKRLKTVIRDSESESVSESSEDPLTQPIPQELEPERLASETATDEDEDDNAEEFVVEAILEHNFESGLKYYLVKWQGYPDSSDWLPEEDLAGAAELVTEYHAKLRKKGKMRVR